MNHNGVKFLNMICCAVFVLVVASSLCKADEGKESGEKNVHVSRFVPKLDFGE